MKRACTILVFLALILAACNLPSNNDNAAPDMESVATLGVITEAAPTQGQQPTLMPVPTLTLVPQAITPIPSLGPTTVVTGSGFTRRRIEFAKGGTSATVYGTVTAPGRVEYILYAFYGQSMSVKITSPNEEANFSVVGINDQYLKRIENEERTWTGTLPVTQDYIISVAVADGSVDFTLSVVILWP